MKYKTINLIFNRRICSSNPNSFIYTSLKPSLEAVGFKVNEIFEEDLNPSSRFLNDDRSICLLVNTFLQCFDAEKVSQLIKNTRGKIGFMGYDDEYMYPWTFHMMRYLDFIVTFDPVVYEYGRSVGLNSILTPHPLPKVHDERPILRENEYLFDVSFIGTVDPAKPNRYEFIEQIRTAFPRCYFPGYYGERISLDKMHEIFSFSKININLTGITARNISPALPLQNARRGFKGRPFEIGLCGGFCLSEYSPALDVVNPSNTVIPFFSNSKEAVEKINFFISNPHDRNNIASNLWEFSSKYISSQSNLNLFGANLKAYAISLEECSGSEINNKKLCFDYPYSPLPSFELERTKQLLRASNLSGFVRNNFFIARKNFILLPVNTFRIIFLITAWLFKKAKSKFIKALLNLARSFLDKRLKSFIKNLLANGSLYLIYSDMDRRISRFVTSDNGYFVELGANDGIAQSNTLFLERTKGWRGLLIEPEPENARLCKKFRKKSVTVQAACVSSKDGLKEVEILTADLMAVTLGIGSTLDDTQKHAARAVTNGHVKKIGRASVPAMPLSVVLDSVAAPFIIDFMSLDVEGAEIEVLKGVDFKKYRFNTILIETKDIRSVESYLNSFGYVFREKITKHDYIFSHSGELKH